MSLWEDRLFLAALASASVAFILVVVDLGETPLIFENWHAEVLFAVPLMLCTAWTWIRQRKGGKAEPEF